MSPVTEWFSVVLYTVSTNMTEFWVVIQSNPMSITEAGQGLYFRLFLKIYNTKTQINSN